ncbi:MAG TPA: hypothetical protein P5272_02680, partial [Caldisericia bacterium]|nr:hypothetical protein [Caldisericia bacterium]
MKKILLITILIMLGFSFLTVKVNANITDVIFTANTIGSQTTQGDDTAGKGGTHWVVTLNFNNNTPLL